MPNHPWDDPIVAEVRAVREAYAASLGYDVSRIIRDLQEKEQRHPERVVAIDPRRTGSWLAGRRSGDIAT